MGNPIHYDRPPPAGADPSCPDRGTGPAFAAALRASGALADGDFYFARRDGQRSVVERDEYEPADDGYGGDPASAHNPADETFLLSAERARRVAGVSRAAAVAGDPWAALRLELVQQVLASTDPWRASRGRSRLLANPPVAVVSRATLRPPQAPPVGMSALVARTVAGARMAETRALLAALEDRIVGLEARRAAAAAAGGEGDGGSGGGRE